MEKTWQLEDHLCKKCGGRILKSASESGANSKGETLFRCANCGKAEYGFSPSVICWCGMDHTHQGASKYKCAPYSVLENRPDLLESFKACGYDPENGAEVGVLLTKDLSAANEKKQENVETIWIPLNSMKYLK